MIASSSGDRSSRCRFSMSAISRAVASSKRSMIAGIVSFPASFDARQRRSPAMIWYSSPAGRTRIGCSTPCSRIDAASSWRVSSWKVMRGCSGFGMTFSTGSSLMEFGPFDARRLTMPCWASRSCWKMRVPASRNDLPLLVSIRHLLREVDEGLRRVRLRVVHRDRDAGGRRFADLHRLTDDGPEDLVVTEVAQRVEHVASEDRAAVVERRQHPEDLELRVQPLLHRLDDLEQRGHAFQRVVLGLHRDDHAIRSHERVQREQAERRRAVDEDVVVALDDVLRQLVAERHLAADRAEQLDLRGGELDVRGRDIEMLRLRVQDDRGEGRVGLDEHVRHPALDGPEVDPEADSEIRLRVEVDAEDGVPELGERSTEVDGAGRLADATLLVRERNDLAQTPTPVALLPARGSGARCRAYVPTCGTASDHAPGLKASTTCERY